MVDRVVLRLGGTRGQWLAVELPIGVVGCGGGERGRVVGADLLFTEWNESQTDEPPATNGANWDSPATKGANL